MRLALLVLLVAAGCGPGPSGLAPDDAFQASLAAVDQGDVPRALVLLDEAAAAGHLGALEYRARSYRLGYLRTDRYNGWQRGKIEDAHPFLVLPGQAEAAEAEYQSALRSAADAGDPDAMFRLALELGQRRWLGGEWVRTASGLDSARVLYDRLVAADAPPRDLAALARVLDLGPDRWSHLARAAQAGDPVACLHRAYDEHGVPFSARYLAAAIDALEACREMAAGTPTPVAFDHNDQTLGALAEQVRAGNRAARVILDSLRADGVFERHPRLAAVVAERRRG